MMLVRDKLDNLFSTIFSKSPDLLIFSYFDSGVLDVLFSNLHGEKRLSKIGKLDIDLIATMIISMFGRKWDKTIETYVDSMLDIGKGGYVVSENQVSNNINTISRTVLNKVSAFNDDELSDNVEDLEELTGGTDGTETNQKEVIKNVGIDNVVKIMDFLNHFYLYDIIMVDVNELLTLKIY